MDSQEGTDPVPSHPQQWSESSTLANHLSCRSHPEMLLDRHRLWVFSVFLWITTAVDIMSDTDCCYCRDRQTLTEPVSVQVYAQRYRWTLWAGGGLFVWPREDAIGGPQQPTALPRALCAVRLGRMEPMCTCKNCILFYLPLYSYTLCSMFTWEGKSFQHHLRDSGTDWLVWKQSSEQSDEMCLIWWEMGSCITFNKVLWQQE